LCSRPEGADGSLLGAVTTARVGRREWVGLGVIALPGLLDVMGLAVLNLAVPHLGANLAPAAPS
jgi:MFS transporter, DHA2 family, multidrug resistance protein